jgi:UDP-3-O-[3-hydroxymyristoyl] glucosamine N-acyltransferase
VPLRLGDIAEITGGVLAGDPSIFITGVAKIEEARPGEITFLANHKYAKHLGETRASALIVPDDMPGNFDKPVIRSKNPYLAFMKAVVVFHPPKPLIEKGIHSTAVIGENTELGTELSIGAYAVIGRRCRIGHRTIVMPGVILGDGAMVGDDCVLHANVCLREGVVLGNRVILHNGTVVGSDGFGFALDGGKYHKIPQVGTVVIEDDVEIGSNTSIDRATLGETRIKRGTKMDNLIQIAHNCSVGEDTVIAAQVGIAGSTVIGNNCRIGGQAGFAGHIKVGDNTTVGGGSGVLRPVSGNTMVSGFPARPHRDELHVQAAMHKLPELLKELKQLKERIQKLEQELKKEC